MPLKPRTQTDIATLVELLRWRALEQGDEQAAAFLDDEHDAVGRLSYAALDERARAIAALLGQRAGVGARALLLYSPGLDFVAAFFGCLYAGIVAVPAYPPRPRTLARLQAIVDDAQPAVVLTTTDVRDLVQPMLTEAPDFPALPWLTTDDLAPGLAADWRDLQITADHLAFLQYTSGSTSAPRGVMVSHGNLIHNSHMIHHAFETRPDQPGVIWLPLYHDMGLIGGVLQPIFAGFPLTLMSPLTFLQRPFRWLQAISQLRAVISGGPNFAYDLCVRKITPEQRATLDLSTWHMAFSGAEPVRAETIERFTAAFAPSGFRREAWYPCYGLAEATLFVTGVRKSEPPRYATVSAPALEQRTVALAADGAAGDTRTLVSCGTAWLDQEVAIVNPDTEARCPAAAVGEIWVSGPSVAQGYWGRLEDSERVFRARIAGEADGRTWLRTGDLGFLQDNQLYVAGRIKDLIIIDGRNHYPQDIEATLEMAHPALRANASAAFSVEMDGEEKLVVVAELEREHMPGRPGAASPEQLTAAARRVIAEQHTVQLHELVLIRTGYIPKTTSGKIQRHACQRGYLDGTLNRVNGPA